CAKLLCARAARRLHRASRPSVWLRNRTAPSTAGFFCAWRPRRSFRARWRPDGGRSTTRLQVARDWKGSSRSHAACEALQANQSAFVRHRHRLRAADGIELLEDGLDVRLGGAFGDVEPPRNVLVAASLSDLLQHAELTLREARLRHALQRLRRNGG